MGSTMMFTPPTRPVGGSPSSSRSGLVEVSPIVGPNFGTGTPIGPISSSAIGERSDKPYSVSMTTGVTGSITAPVPLSTPGMMPLTFGRSPSAAISVKSVEGSYSASLFFSRAVSV